jgi:hypothetical protein
MARAIFSHQIFRRPISARVCGHLPHYQKANPLLRIRKMRASQEHRAPAGATLEIKIEGNHRPIADMQLADVADVAAFFRTSEHAKYFRHA